MNNDTYCRVFLKCVGAISFMGCTGVDVDALCSWKCVVSTCGTHEYPKKERMTTLMSPPVYVNYDIASFSSSSESISNSNWTLRDLEGPDDYYLLFEGEDMERAWTNSPPPKRIFPKDKPPCFHMVGGRYPLNPENILHQGKVWWKSKYIGYCLISLFRQQKIHNLVINYKPKCLNHDRIDASQIEVNSFFSSFFPSIWIQLHQSHERSTQTLVQVACQRQPLALCEIYFIEDNISLHEC